MVVTPGRALIPVLSLALTGAGAPVLDDVPGMGSGSGDAGNAKGSSRFAVETVAEKFAMLPPAFSRLMPKELEMAALRDDLTEPAHRGEGQ